MSMSNDLSLYLNWNNAISMVTNVGFGLFLSAILLFAYSQIGKRSLLMLPLILWQFLWQSWSGIRNQLFFNYVYDSGMDPEIYYQLYFFIQDILFFAFILLALSPMAMKPREKETLSRQNI